MTHTDNDCLEITQNISDNQKDLWELVPRYFSHRITNKSKGFTGTNFKIQSFVVDWQVSLEEDFDADRPWY